MAEKTQDKKEKLAQYLRVQVLTLGLAPGADLDEETLCGQFDLSRTPLRDVFRDLVGEGYLTYRVGRGVRVSEMSHTTIRAFFQAAPLIYGAILQLAAVNATDPQIAELRGAQDRFKSALRDGSVADRSLSNMAFHDATGEMANSPYLLPSFRRLLIDHARIGMTFYRPLDDDMRSNLSTANDQHDAIISAIETRDQNRAGALALEHWELSRSRIESYVFAQGLEAPLGQTPKRRPA